MSSSEVEKLNYLWHIVGDQLKEEKAKYPLVSGLTMTEMSILQIIESNPKIIFKEICAGLGFPKSTLTSAVNRLEEKGLVKRNSSSRDKRAYYLELTPTGMQAQRAHVLVEHTVFEKLLSNLDGGEVETLIALIFKGLFFLKN